MRKPAGYAARDDVRAFIDEMAAEHGFDRAQLARMFARARYQPAIVAAMDRPLLEPPKWHAYARSFLAPERVAAGVAYWDAHRDDLARAEERYGVPAEIVVAILGVETFYGRNAGNYRVLDALATLAFDYPRRAAFFRGELKQFLLLARELGMSPLAREGIVRRCDGRAAVHAGELSQLRRRLRRQRSSGPLAEPGGHRRAASPIIWRGMIGNRAGRCCCRR